MPRILEHLRHIVIVKMQTYRIKKGWTRSKFVQKYNSRDLDKVFEDCIVNDHKIGYVVLVIRKLIEEFS